MAVFLRKYGAGTDADIYVPIIKRDSVDFAVSADWTPAAGDVKVSKDGGAAANIGTLPTAVTMGNTAMWKFVFSDAELQCKYLSISVSDSATKAVEDQFFAIETYGHASAMYKPDFSDSVRLGLTALPNAAADAAGGLPISDAGGLDLDARMPAAAAVTNLNTVFNTDFATAYNTTTDGWNVNATHAAGTAWNSGAITSGTLATGAIAAGKIGAAALTSGVFDAGALGGQTVFAVTQPVTAGTVSDKTGYSISGTITTLDALDTAQDSQHSTTQSAIAALNNVSTSDVKTQVDTALSDIHLDHLLAVDYDPASKPGVSTALLNELIGNDSGVSQFTANALELGPSGSGGDATASNQATIISHLTDIKGAGWGATDSLADIAGDVTSILADTNELQTNQGNWITATGFSTHSASDVVSAFNADATQITLQTNAANAASSASTAATQATTAATQATAANGIVSSGTHGNAALKALIDTNNTTTAKLATMIESDGAGGWEFTSGSLVNAGDITPGSTTLIAYVSAVGVVGQAASSSGTLTIVRFSDFSVLLTGLGSLTSRDDVVFTVKASETDTDDQALVQASETGGLLRLNGEAASDSTQATITVTDESTGSVRIELSNEVTAALAAAETRPYSVKLIRSNGEAVELTNVDWQSSLTYARIITGITRAVE